MGGGGVAKGVGRCHIDGSMNEFNDGNWNKLKKGKKGRSLGKKVKLNSINIFKKIIKKIREEKRKDEAQKEFRNFDMK